jgi:hypothetical protein
MTLIRRLFCIITVLALAACGGGGGSSGNTGFGSGAGSGTGTGTGTGSTASAKLSVALSNSTVSSAAPVTVSVTVVDATNNAVANSVVAFTTTGGLGTFSARSALTDSSGVATVTLSPAVTSASGADTVVASATVGSASLSGSVGFSLVATSASITAFTTSLGATAAQPLGAYGQTVLTVNLAGVSTATPATLSIASACVTAGKATISPATATVTSSTVTVTYKDTGGCGATLTADTLTASVSGTSSQQVLQLYLSSPAANNIVFVSATPPTIYLQGTGLTTSSQVVFQVNDLANNPLPGKSVTLSLNTSAGGITLDGGAVQTTDSNGRVSALINSGTVPTPARVTATLTGSGISTVSSNLSVAVGLPTETRFSLSQGTFNIEGFNRDGTANSYTVIASDRLGNPVPDGTVINFVSEGGQVQASAQTVTIATANTPCPASVSASSTTGVGLSCAVARFQSSAPKPPDGRVTVLAYALGEKSFIDGNGSNVYETGESYQDLGNPFIDTLYNGVYGSSGNNQFIAQSPLGSGACNAGGLPSSLQLDVSTPSMPSTCTGAWGKAYVRRAVETIFSTSSSHPSWGVNLPVGAAAATGACPAGTALIRPNTGSTFPAYDASGNPQTLPYYFVGSTALYGQSAAGVLFFYASDSNATAYNPVAAGSTIAVAGTTGLTVSVSGGSPVASSLAPTGVAINYSFADAVVSGTVTISITSPSGLTTSVAQFLSTTTKPNSYSLCQPQ